MTARKAAARSVARVILRGYVKPISIERALQASLGGKRRHIKLLTKAVLAEFAGKRPSVARLAAFLQSQESFAASNGARDNIAIEAKMRPASGRPSSWNVPSILKVGDLADWLNVAPKDLFWFADLRNFESKATTKLCHYMRRWVRKSDGNFRLIESPKQRLKQIQRAILRGILEKIPAHEAAHGFVKDRSILTFTAPHVGKDVVLKIDIRDFFPSFTFTRVHHLYLAAGYPEEVGKLLAGLCTTTCPRKAVEELPGEARTRARDLYCRRHLPQGAPTSPMLANLCAFNLDCRLVGLAKAAGAVYTRYADDLIFSGGRDFERGIERFLIHAMAILLEEGFEAHARKTRVMRQGVAQKAAGLVVNVRPNVSRDDYDTLKAILTNCARHGAESQNRYAFSDFHAQLAGRISHVAMVNPSRAQKLQRIFEAISWPDYNDQPLR